jgi:hypothetical protein
MPRAIPALFTAITMVWNYEGVKSLLDESSADLEVIPEQIPADDGENTKVMETDQHRDLAPCPQMFPAAIRGGDISLRMNTVRNKSELIPH